jgi:hypothetical protein
VGHSVHEAPRVRVEEHSHAESVRRDWYVRGGAFGGSHKYHVQLRCGKVGGENMVRQVLNGRGMLERNRDRKVEDLKTVQELNVAAG